MEIIWNYFLKVNGLLLVHFLMYQFLLRKETFFQKNRLFLLFGIVVSLVLPLFSYTKVIWIEAEPVVIDWENLMNQTPTETIAEESTFDWLSMLFKIYIGVGLLFLVNLAIEFRSLFKIVKKGNINKKNNIWFVETEEGKNPFSFFNVLVYNKEKFTTEELELIFLHEKIHIEQRHSIDVLIGKLLCFFLWINPIAWLYRKAMLQNLEYIADAETARLSNNSVQYQKTLLKSIVSNNHQLSITNQFYQSLIKKRIVMLNQKSSNQRNAWKFAAVLPALLVFFILFNVKTQAKIREIESPTQEKSVKVVEVIQFLITKNTTDAEIKTETELLKKEHGITLKVSKVKRNEANEIIALSISYKDGSGNSGQISKKSDAPIEPILFYKELGENGKIGFGDQTTTTIVKEITWNEAMPEIETIDVRKTENGEDIYIINGKEYSKEELKDKKVEVDGSITVNENDKTKKKIMIFNGNSKITDVEDQTVIFLDDDEISKTEMENLDQEMIKTVTVNKGNTKNEIRIVTKKSTSIPDGTEIYINGIKATQKELEETAPEEIETMNVINKGDKKVIEIWKKGFDQSKTGLQKTEMEKAKADMLKAKADIEKAKAEIERVKLEIEKTKPQQEKAKADIEKAKIEIEQAKKDLEKAKTKKIAPIAIETEDGDYNVLFSGNMLKIPGEPTTKIAQNGPSIYVNGKKLANAEEFLSLDHSKIYYLEASEKETLTDGKVKVKRIDVKMK